jgi:hypothetical protein
VPASLKSSAHCCDLRHRRSGATKFLVMALVPGATLAERIKRGPIPIDEALKFAKNICETLGPRRKKAWCTAI